MSPIPRVRGGRRRGGADGASGVEARRADPLRDATGSRRRTVEASARRAETDEETENGNQNGLIAGFYPAFHYAIIGNIALFIRIYPFITPFWALCNKLQQDFATSTPPRLMTTCAAAVCGPAVAAVLCSCPHRSRSRRSRAIEASRSWACVTRSPSMARSATSSAVAAVLPPGDLRA